MSLSQKKWSQNREISLVNERGYAVAELHQGAPGQMTGWKIHRPGSALPSPAYCFVSVIV